MAGMFIDVVVAPEVAKDKDLAAKLTEVCPVAIFAVNGNGTLKIAEENLDECVLCDLCIEAAPSGSVQVKKLYETE